MIRGYIEAIGENWPLVQCHAVGPAYTDLVWESGDPIPSQAELDAWLANPITLPENVRHITVLAFRNRYTGNEKMMIELAAAHNPGAAIEDQMNSAYMRSYLKDLDNAAYVDLDRDDTRSGAMAMEALGLIAAGRALVILDSPIQAFEIPTYPSMDS